MRDEPAEMSDRLLATVVIPVRNGGERLHELVRALELQTVGPERFEVVVGDDGSTDGSTAALESDVLSLRVTSEPAQNSYAARNRAAGMSRAPVLAFCDADCLPDRDWLETGLRALESTDVVVGAIPWQVPAKPTAWTLLDIDLHLDSSQAVQEQRCLGANLFVRRELFDRLGGFDESLPSGGDTDFGRRASQARSRLTHEPGARVLHPTRDGGHALLQKVWRINRASAVRRLRAGERSCFLRTLIPPPLALARGRLHRGRSLGVDRTRLDAAGVRCGYRIWLQATLLLYFAVTHVAWAAAHAARRDARREERLERRLEVLLVCSPGGHLLQLLALRPAWDGFRRAWVTLEAADTRSLLDAEDVQWAHAPTTRNLVNLIRNLALAWKLIGRRRPAVVVTTGAAIAVPFAWAGRLRGAKVLYVESLTRVDRPSLSCRLLAPAAHRIYVQWPELQQAMPKSRFAGNALSSS